ncbi:hypothetical protein E4H12_13210 [Candidatus Thorarchaeota archaeon]|nr:MAG: hypothetical protein E4H12_13210 [Candidatus Thorarchaeota archaeon]
MLITSFFTKNSVPKLGLTPTIRIWSVTDVSQTLVVNGDSMLEVGDGFYKYDFTLYDFNQDYVFRADGGIPQLDERYQYGASEYCRLEIETIQSIADQVWDEDASTHITPGTTGALLNLITAVMVNRTKIDIGAATLTIYDGDCVTPLIVFDLKDSAGNPSVTEVCERVPTTC